jgi:hypothetical protein
MYGNLQMLRAGLTSAIAFEVGKIPEADMRADMTKTLGAVSGEIEDFTKKAAAIRADTLLSPAGQQEKIRALAYEAKDKAIKTLPVIVADDLDTELISSLTDPKPAEPVLDYLKFQEVRSRLASEDPSQLRSRYIADIQKDGASLIVRALESDPLPRSFVTTESRAISKMSRLRDVAPERAARIEEAREAKNITVKLAGYISTSFNSAA